jgi:hypothetical protein
MPMPEELSVMRVVAEEVDQRRSGGVESDAKGCERRPTSADADERVLLSAVTR